MAETGSNRGWAAMLLLAGLNITLIGVVCLLLQYSMAAVVDPRLTGAAFFAAVARKMFSDWMWIPTASGLLLTMTGATFISLSLVHATNWRPIPTTSRAQRISFAAISAFGALVLGSWLIFG